MLIPNFAHWYNVLYLLILQLNSFWYLRFFMSTCSVSYFHLVVWAFTLTPLAVIPGGWGWKWAANTCLFNWPIGFASSTVKLVSSPALLERSALLQWEMPTVLEMLLLVERLILLKKTRSHWQFGSLATSSIARREHTNWLFQIITCTDQHMHSPTPCTTMTRH